MKIPTSNRSRKPGLLRQWRRDRQHAIAQRHPAEQLERTALELALERAKQRSGK